MSDFSQLPARPSLEQLRKQAKDLLRAFDAGDASARDRVRAVNPRLVADSAPRALTLGDAQFVRARELGFEHWAALVRQVEAARMPRELDALEQSARDIVDAYGGDAGSMERVRERLALNFSSEEFRARIVQRKRMLLGADVDETLSLDHARLFLARHYDFDTWADLLDHARASSPREGRPGSLLYTIDTGTNTIRPRQPLSNRDWDELVAVMEEHGITGLDGAGQVTDAAMQRVSRLESITHLGLGDSAQLTDEGMLHLARMPQLEHLVAGGWNRRITDRGLGALRHLVNLRLCSLYGRQGITDAGVANLTFCDRLEKVDLLGSSTGDGAIDALTGKNALRHLQAGTNVTDAGLALVRRFPVFRTWQGGDVEYSLGGFDAKPNYLWFNTKAPFTDAGLARLSALEGAFAISLFGGANGPFDDSSSPLTGHGLASLVDLPHLGWLGCAHRLGNDEAMRHIAAMPHLRMLSCQDAVAGDDGFVALSQSGSLELISGRRCHNLGSRGLTALADMPRLQGLSVSCRNVDDTGLAALPRFRALRELTAIDIPDSGYRHIGRCVTLEMLWPGRDTTDAATEQIRGLPALTTYGLSPNMTDRSLEILAGMPSIERLSMGSTRGITNAGLALLAKLPRLKELTLNNLPNVTRQGLAVLPEHVRVSYSTE